VAIRPNGAVLRQLQTLFDLGSIGELTDGQLLERFTRSSGEPAELAFAALVERHGPMVLRVCRSSLRDPNDVQDAFQATFLVLVRKAQSLWVQDSLGPWLHRVAHRVASRARKSAARRRLHERLAAEAKPMWMSVATEWNDFFIVLHEEIDRLPERCRVPVVLCDLEGFTHEQAARRLRWPVGTVKSRLTRGRELMRGRLVRRGFASVAGLVGVVSTAPSAPAAVPAELIEATVQATRYFAAGANAAGGIPAAVVLLSEGAMKAMFVTKLKLAVLACGLLATGAFVVAQNAGRAPETEAQPLEARTTRNPSPLSKVPDSVDAAVAREMGRLDLDLLAEEVQQLRDQVQVTLREKIRAEQRNSGKAGEGTGIPPQAVKDAQAAYESARTVYLTKARELRSAQRPLAVAKSNEPVAGSLAQGQEPKPPTGTAPVPKGNEDTPAKAAKELADELKRHPAQPSKLAIRRGMYLMDLVQGDVTMIADEPEPGADSCGSPRWSHNGKRIIFDAMPNMAFQSLRIKVIEIGDRGLIMTDLGPGARPTFSPNDTRIAFLLHHNAAQGAEPGIWVMQADGSERRFAGEWFGMPLWSPDGRQFLVAGFDDPREMSLINIGKAELRSIQIPGHRVFGWPSWADKGTVSAIVGSDGIGDTVALLDVSDHEPGKIKEVVFKPGNDLDIKPLWPVYSPSTRRCVFVGVKPKGMALYSVEHGQSGRAKRLEAGPPDPQIGGLAFSPDGRYLLFCSTRPIRPRP